MRDRVLAAACDAHLAHLITQACPGKADVRVLEVPETTQNMRCSCGKAASWQVRTLPQPVAAAAPQGRALRDPQGTVMVDDDSYEGGKREAVVMWVIKTNGACSYVMLENGARRWVETDAIKRD